MHITAFSYKGDKAVKFIFDKHSDNRKRLENILRFIRDILESREPYKSQTVFYIIKILTDRINSGKCIDKLCESHSKPDYSIDIEDDNIINTRNEVELKRPITIRLGKDPVLVSFKDREKIVKRLATIGTKENKWEQRTTVGTDKHCFNLFLPIGVTEICEGRHSVYSGIVKGVGKLTYTPGDKNQKVFDISYLYDEIYYDGYCYRNISENKKIEEVPFEYGCIFEIGRLIKEHNISFLNIKYSEFESENE